MEETISLKEIFETLKKRLVFIILITLGAVAASAIITFFVLTPQYEASTQILVNQSSTDREQLTANELQSNRELINTYNVIMKSPAILEQVQQELSSSLSVQSINDKITVSSEEDSQVVALTVTDEDPVYAAEIANTTAEVFEQEIVDIMNIDNVSILSEAALSDNASPVSPQPALNMAIAFVMGLMTGIGLAFLLEFLDNTIKTEKDLEKELEIPVLGVISEIEQEDIKQTSSSNAREGRKRKGVEKIS
ncbi:YveK family protein [Alteribacillus sp. JSM 102045]|uniref:YveK family protein n=1 Tax=Alteribacillus sp. JSM 102045 TaxID=1562101 RepID=UPI0035BF6877